MNTSTCILAAILLGYRQDGQSLVRGAAAPRAPPWPALSIGTSQSLLMAAETHLFLSAQRLTYSAVRKGVWSA